MACRIKRKIKIQTVFKPTPTMEILARKHEHDEHRRHHLVHCIVHFTLEVAALAIGIATLNEVERIHRRIKSMKK